MNARDLESTSADETFECRRREVPEMARHVPRVPVGGIRVGVDAVVVRHRHDQTAIGDEEPPRPHELRAGLEALGAEISAPSVAHVLRRA